jgi:hypothetical protein
MMSLLKWLPRSENLVDLAANTMPWAGGLVPATMIYQNVQTRLGYTPGQALIVGIVVEVIGFVAVTTSIDIYEAMQKENDRKSLIGLLLISITVSVVYLTVVLIVNSLLDDGNFLHQFGNGLLSMFGLLGGLLVALRNQLHKRIKAGADLTARIEAEAQHADEFQRQMEVERMHLEHETDLKKIDADNLRKIEKIRADSLRKASAQTPDGSGAGQKTTGDIADGHRRWKDIPESDYEWIENAPAGDIVKKYGLSGKDPKRQARAWKEYARERGPETSSPLEAK